MANDLDIKNYPSDDADGGRSRMGDSYQTDADDDETEEDPLTETQKLARLMVGATTLYNAMWSIHSKSANDLISQLRLEIMQEIVKFDMQSVSSIGLLWAIDELTRPHREHGFNIGVVPQL